MRNRVRLRITPATVIASIALLVALGGTSMAAVTATAPANSVNTAALKNNAVTNPKIGGNAVTGDKVKNGSLKKADFAPGQIPAGPPGPEGPAGAAGPQGPAGPAGASATALWASVDQNGTLVRSKGVASAQKNGTGSYQVVFNQDVTGCGYQATVGGSNDGSQQRPDHDQSASGRERRRSRPDLHPNGVGKPGLGLPPDCLLLI